MKIRHFYLTAAIVACGFSSASAQIQLLDQGLSPTPAPVLVSGQLDFGDSEVSSLDSPVADSVSLDPPAREVTENPFDFLQESSSRSSTEDSSPADREPPSLPVGRHHRRTVVDTIVDHSMVSNVPNASCAPVQWGQPCRTPNPTAQVLLRQECVNGLWDGYAAQRAQECSRMWNRIHGVHDCGCGATCAASGCDSCNAAPVNRYRPHTISSACDGGCDSGCNGGCSSLSQLPPPPSPVEIPQIETVSEKKLEAADSNAVATSDDKVAFLPLPVLR